MLSMKTPHTTKPASQQRIRIIEAAIELLAVHGFTGMTMRQLGARVGLDNSSLYRHFRSKSDVIHAAIDHAADHMKAFADPWLDDPEDLTLSSLTDACATMAAYLFDNPNTARLMLHWFMSMGSDGPGPDISVQASRTDRPSGALLAATRAKLEGGAQAGVLRACSDPDTLIALLGVLLLRAATYGYFLNSADADRDRDTARLAWENEVRIWVHSAFAP